MEITFLFFNKYKGDKRLFTKGASLKNRIIFLFYLGHFTFERNSK